MYVYGLLIEKWRAIFIQPRKHIQNWRDIRKQFIHHHQRLALCGTLTYKSPLRWHRHLCTAGLLLVCGDVAPPDPILQGLAGRVDVCEPGRHSGGELVRRETEECFEVQLLQTGHAGVDPVTLRQQCRIQRTIPASAGSSGQRGQVDPVVEHPQGLLQHSLNALSAFFFVVTFTVTVNRGREGHQCVNQLLEGGIELSLVEDVLLGLQPEHDRQVRPVRRWPVHNQVATGYVLPRDDAEYGHLHEKRLAHRVPERFQVLRRLNTRNFAVSDLPQRVPKRLLYVDR